MEAESRVFVTMVASLGTAEVGVSLHGLGLLVAFHVWEMGSDPSRPVHPRHAVGLSR